MAGIVIAAEPKPAQLGGYARGPMETELLSVTDAPMSLYLPS
jgi:hypothetical protein